MKFISKEDECIIFVYFNLKSYNKFWKVVRKSIFWPTIRDQSGNFSWDGETDELSEDEDKYDQGILYLFMDPKLGSKQEYTSLKW